MGAYGLPSFLPSKNPLLNRISQSPLTICHFNLIISLEQGKMRKFQVLLALLKEKD